MAAVLIQLGNVLNQSFINPRLINTVVREGIPGKTPFLLGMAQIIPALARNLANCFSFKEDMAFKTTHNKDESLPQFMKSPQLIFSHN